MCVPRKKVRLANGGDERLVIAIVRRVSGCLELSLEEPERRLNRHHDRAEAAVLIGRPACERMTGDEALDRVLDARCRAVTVAAGVPRLGEGAFDCLR